MRKRLHVEVEPLSESQWAKIERSLLARVQLEGRGLEPLRKQRSMRYRSLSIWLAAALTVSVVAGVFLALDGSTVPTAMEHASRITTGQSSSHLALPGLTVDVEPQSAVVVGVETAHGVLLVLDRGSIVCQVARRPSNAPLVVQAGAVRVQVIGTRFRVVRDGEVAGVEVYEGVVEVTSAGQSWRVLAGQRWPAVSAPQPSEPTAAGATSSSAPPEPMPLVEPPGAVGPVLPKAGSNQTLAKSRSSSPSPVPQDAPKSPPPKPPVAEGPAKEGPAADGAASDHASSRPQAVFEQATALERSDPARASRLYRSLESGEGTWAQNALYARGRLAASRGNTGEARLLLERYLERFPRGSNAQDARAVLQRLR
jgi:FecR protein